MRVTIKGQVTIPKDVREKLGIQPLSEVEFVEEQGRYLTLREITEDEVRRADELWVTSSTKEVLAVTTLDGTPVGNGKPGPLFRRMHALFQEHKAQLARQAALAA